MSKKVMRRSPHAQLRAMKELWPDFVGERKGSGLLVWGGPLKPKAKTYFVNVFWWPGHMSLPYVMLDEPKLQPRKGGSFEEIPHLLFYEEKPELSGLCLFDPEANEWTEADLIAETTIRWTSEWITYYEFWHLTGTWLGPSVGLESVAQMRAAEAKAIRECLADVH